MAVTTADQFLDLLAKSELLEPEQLGEARGALHEGDDARALAKKLIQARLLTEWQAGQILVGRTLFFLGKYKLIKMLGRGGMGAVFLAEHMTMNRRVALKTISRKVSKEPEALKRFLDEARAVAALDHRNIVQAYSVDKEDDRFFLVMEYVEGQDLEQLVQSKDTLDPNIAADCIRQAAEGLEHGHGRGMIHCDIKPANLLLNEEGVIKIVDMGLSQLQDPNEARKKDDNKDSKDQALGSVDFLAPEQAMGGKDFDHRADIYSLGCTLYYLLTGRPPFPEGMLHEKLMKHQTMQPEAIGKLRKGLPEKLIAVCGTMMAKKPDDRYQSAAEVAKALAEFPAPKRRAKPAAALKKAEMLPESLPQAAAVAGPAVPSVQAGQSVAGRRTAARKKSGFLDSPQQKMIAIGAVAAGLLVLLAILVPYMLSSSDPGESKPDPDDWLAGNTQGNGQPAPKPGESPKPGEEPAISLPAVSLPVPNGLDVPYRIIPKGLRNGLMAYTDRDYTLTSVPSLLEGATYLQTANDDKGSKGTAFLTFGISGDATVYVGLDERRKDRQPWWLKKFAKTGEKLVRQEEENRRLILLKKDFPAGTVTLGGNGGSSKSSAMYVVAVVPRSGSELTVSYHKTVPPSEAIAAVKPLSEPTTDVAAPEDPPGTTVATNDPGGAAVAMRATDSEKVAEPPASPPPARKLMVPEGLVARFTFDEDAGDSVGQHKGAFMGDATVVEDPDRGGVLKLGGNGDYVSFAGMVDLTGGEYSVALWFKSTVGSHKTLIAGTKAAHGMLLELKDGKLRYLHRFPFNSKADMSFSTDKKYNDGQWHHLVAVKDSANGTLYVDGANVGSMVNSTTFNVPMKFVAGRLSISQSERYFQGFIDELRFYKRALTPEEVAKVAAPEPTPFDKLAKTGSLERFDKQSEPAGAHVIGELILLPDATVYLTLLGGNDAIRGSRKFLMEEIEDGREWRVYLDVESKTGGEAVRSVVARVLVSGQLLGLEWAKGVSRETANSLLNCALDISVDDESCFLPLARPQVVEPLVVNLDAGANRKNYAAESLPEHESLRLQVVRLKGGFPKPEFNPSDILTSGGVTEITFNPKVFPKFWLRLGFDLKSRVATVDVTANIDYQIPQRPPDLFKAREAGRFMNELAARKQRLVKQLEGTNDGRKRGEINKKLKPINEKVAKYAKLNELYAKCKDNPGEVLFRVYMVIDEERRVTVLQSFPLKKPESNEEVPSSDGTGPE